jgi:uncharacterized membrane protein
LKTDKKLVKMAELAILTAIVIIFQMLGSFIHIGPTSISLVLVPIAAGAIILGPASGAFLGFVFGAITLWAGISGTDLFTSVLFAAHPVYTSLICILKATLAGLAAGLVFKALKNKNSYVAAIAACAACPIVNTGLFILGSLLFLSETISANFAPGISVVYFLIIICAGLNFIAELLLNVILSPAICRLYKILNKI